MGNIVSLFRKKEEADYEVVLSKLDESIRKAELRLNDIRLRERKYTIVSLIYTAFGYAVYVASYLLYLRRPGLDTPSQWIAKVAPLILIPVFIYFIKSFIRFWFTRKQVSEEAHLTHLRAEQKTKVEELKKKTAYYSTRNLLERYDPATRSTISEGQGDGSGKGRRPQSAGPHPNHPSSPGLRQRQAYSNHQQGGRPTGGVMSGGAVPISGMLQGAGQGSGGKGSVSHSGPSSFPGSGASPDHMSPPSERQWYDKLVDLIVGEEAVNAESHKYALICGRCYAHNGLVLPEEIETIQYVCPKCKYFNPSRKHRVNQAAASRRASQASVPSPSPGPQSGSEEARASGGVSPSPPSQKPSPSPASPSSSSSSPPSPSPSPSSSSPLILTTPSPSDPSQAVQARSGSDEDEVLVEKIGTEDPSGDATDAQDELVASGTGAATKTSS